MSDVQAEPQAVESAAPAVSEAGESQAIASSPAESSLNGADSLPTNATESPAEPSREALIAHMRAKFDALEAKIKTGAVVYAHEVADLFGHVKAVL